MVKNMVEVDGKWHEIDDEEKFGQNDIKVVPLKDEDTIVKDDKSKKEKISKNLNTATANEANKKENLSQTISGSLKKGSIKHNARDWFEEKEKKEKDDEDSPGSQIILSIIFFILIALLGFFGQR